MKWFYQTDEKFCKLVSNTKAQFKKRNSKPGPEPEHKRK